MYYRNDEFKEAVKAFAQDPSALGKITCINKLDRFIKVETGVAGVQVILQNQFSDAWREVLLYSTERNELADYGEINKQYREQYMEELKKRLTLMYQDENIAANPAVPSEWQKEHLRDRFIGDEEGPAIEQRCPVPRELRLDDLCKYWSNPDALVEEKLNDLFEEKEAELKEGLEDYAGKVAYWESLSKDEGALLLKETYCTLAENLGDVKNVKVVFDFDPEEAYSYPLCHLLRVAKSNSCSFSSWEMPSAQRDRFESFERDFDRRSVHFDQVSRVLYRNKVLWERK